MDNGLSSGMGELMATLLVLVDAWFEIAREAAPQRYQPGDRIEVLGQLVRFLSQLFHGFKRIPFIDDIALVVTIDSVGLRISCPGGLSGSRGEVEATLHAYGFAIDDQDHGDGHTVVLMCSSPPSATILPFARPRSRRTPPGGEPLRGRDC